MRDKEKTHTFLFFFAVEVARCAQAGLPDLQNRAYSASKSIRLPVRVMMMSTTSLEPGQLSRLSKSRARSTLNTQQQRHRRWRTNSPVPTTLLLPLLPKTKTKMTRPSSLGWTVCRCRSTGLFRPRKNQCKRKASKTRPTQTRAATPTSKLRPGKRNENFKLRFQSKGASLVQLLPQPP